MLNFKGTFAGQFRPPSYAHISSIPTENPEHTHHMSYLLPQLPYHDLVSTSRPRGCARTSHSQLPALAQRVVLHPPRSALLKRWVQCEHRIASLYFWLWQRPTPSLCMIMIRASWAPQVELDRSLDVRMIMLCIRKGRDCFKENLHNTSTLCTFHLVHVSRVKLLAKVGPASYLLRPSHLRDPQFIFGWGDGLPSSARLPQGL